MFLILIFFSLKKNKEKNLNLSYNLARGKFEHSLSSKTNLALLFLILSSFIKKKLVPPFTLLAIIIIVNIAFTIYYHLFPEPFTFLSLLLHHHLYHQ